MEGLYQVKEILSEKDFMVKLDLQDTYFSIQLHRNSRKYVTFQSEWRFFEFRRRFGLGPASQIFTKLLKIPIPLLQILRILFVYMIS